MKKPKTGLKRGITALLASLFLLSLFATNIAQANESKINQFLGTSSYKVEKTGEGGDGIYFNSEFSTLKGSLNTKLSNRLKGKKRLFCTDGG